MSGVFLMALRSQAGPALLVGFGVTALAALAVAIYFLQFGPDVADRQRALVELRVLMEATRALFGEPVDVTTAGGFVHWRVLGPLPVAIGVWAVLVGSGQSRGEEQRGVLELELATAHRRREILAARWLALATLTAGISLGLWVGLLLGGVGFEPLEAGLALAAATNVGFQVLLWGTAAMLAAQQLATRRGAALWAGLVMAGAWFASNLAETLPQELGWLRYVTPFAAYAANKPLAGGWMFHPAYLVAPAVTLALLAASVAALERRDIGDVVLRRRRARGAPNPIHLPGRGIFATSLRALLPTTVGWGLGIGAFGVLIVALTPLVLETMREVFQPGTPLGAIVGALVTAERYLGLAFFTFYPVLMSVVATSMLASWAADEESGRLGLIVATARRRVAVLILAVTPLLLAQVLIAALAAGLVLLAATTTGMEFDRVRFLAGVGAGALLGFAVFLVGLALAAWRRRPSAAVGIVALWIGVSFFWSVIAAALGLDEPWRHASIFRLYGEPLGGDLPSGGWSVLAALALAGAVVAVAGFLHRDLARS